MAKKSKGKVGHKPAQTDALEQSPDADAGSSEIDSEQQEAAATDEAEAELEAGSLEATESRESTESSETGPDFVAGAVEGGKSSAAAAPEAKESATAEDATAEVAPAAEFEEAGVEPVTEADPGLQAVGVEGSSEAALAGPDTALDDEEDDAAALAEATGEALVDQDTALAEFAHYDSLDEELAGDRQLESAQDSTGEGDSRLTPKERRLQTMRLEAKVEAVIFASQKPLKPQEILDTLADPTVSVDDVQTTLDILVEFYADRCGGFRLHYLKRLGYQFQTADSAGPIMERMFASRPRPISRAALETLSIIAYRQPVTRAEVEFIRGVDAGSIFKTLLERDLIKCTGRKEIVGRPMLFGTTDNFLTVFNLSSIKDLPPLESFQPSREMVQGAMERIDGQADDLVDVEEYIADNTRGGYEGDDPELVGEDADAAEEAPADAEALRLEGATSRDTTEIAPAAETAPEQSEDSPGELTQDNDADSEVAQPDGDSLPAGSRDLDQ